MRPRLITAENLWHSRIEDMFGEGFNEAAAHHRGEPPFGSDPAAGSEPLQ